MKKFIRFDLQNDLDDHQNLDDLSSDDESFDQSTTNYQHIDSNIGVEKQKKYRLNSDSIYFSSSFRLKLIRSQISGYGIITKQAIKKDSFIIEYVGEIISNKERNRRFSDNLENEYFFKLTNKLVIDSRNYGNLSRFINHSCRPNCYSMYFYRDGYKCIGYYALINIRKNTELTIDYYLDGSYNIKCKCSPTCTKIL